MSLFQGDAPTPVELESSAVQSAPQYLTNYLTQLASAGTQALGTPTYDAEGKITGVTPSTSASLITPMSALQQGAYIGAGGTPTYNAQGQIIGYTGSPLTSYTGALTNAASAFDRQPVTSEDITGFLNPERATGYESTLSKAIEALQPSVTASDVTKLLDPNRATTYEPIFEKSLSALSPLTAQERINAFYKPFTSQSETGGLGLRSFDEAQRAFQRQPVSQSDIRAFYNPYEQSVVDEMAKQSAINYQRNVLPSLKAGFVGQGDLGSRRYSNVLGQTAADIQSNLLAQQAKARSQGYETALEAALKEAGYDIQSGVGLTSLGKAEQEGYKTALEAALKESQTDVSKAQALTNLGAEERRSFSDALRSALELEQLGVTSGTGLTSAARAQMDPYNEAVKAALMEAGYDVQAGTGLSNLGRTEQEAAEEAYGALAKLGSQQTAYEQAKLEAPLTRAANVAQLMRGYAYPTSTESKAETFPPMYNKSPLEQIAGLSSLIGAAFPAGGGGAGDRLLSTIANVAGQIFGKSATNVGLDLPTGFNSWADYINAAQSDTPPI